MARLTDKTLALARRGDQEGVRAVLASDPDLIEARQYGHGRSLLWEAVRYGRVELVDFLLERGAPVDARGRRRCRCSDPQGRHGAPRRGAGRIL